MTGINLSLEHLHLIGVFTILSCLNVKLLFSCHSRLYLYFSIIHTRKQFFNKKFITSVTKVHGLNNHQLINT